MIRKLRIITTLIFIMLATAFNLSGQTGSIEGTVLDKHTKDALIGTTVMIEGTSIGTASDINGHFILNNIKPGLYKIVVTYISYSPSKYDNVEVSPEKSTQLDVFMEEETIILGDVTITAIRKTNTDLSVISAIKGSPFISTGISSQQISRTLDKDASEVIKRVPGITIQDDRFLVVRGLSQRYNNVWLNSAATPSSEADVKSFSFDVIPSSMIENIMIFKSPAAELPADFSGGFVKISTRNMPEKNSMVFTYSTGFNQGATFGDYNKYKGSPTDWLGFDNGARALPKDMPGHLNDYELATNPDVRNKITDLGRELSNTWSAADAIAIPDQKYLFGVNHRFDIGKTTLGTATGLTYSYTNNSDLIEVTDYSIYDFTNDRPSYLNQYYDQQYSNSARVTLMSNWSLLLDGGSKIELRNLFSQVGTTRTTVRDGREWYNDGRYIQAEELRYLSRTVYSGQLAGEHTFGKSDLKIEWVLGYSATGKSEPDTRRYKYLRNPVDTADYFMTFLDQADLSSQSRMWIDLKENTVSAALNLTHKLNINGFQPEIRTGFYIEDKERVFDARNFGYAKGSFESTFGQTSLPVEQIFTDNNINLTTGIKLVEVTALSDSYDAANKQIAGYLSVKWPIGSKINLYSGIRVEKNRQMLASYKQGSTIEVDVNRDTVNIFPSLNLTYNINEKNLVRAAYGMSVNRPEFREIAPFYYVDFDINAGIYGAPEIKQAYVHNFDIRYEMYPKSGETFSLGAFYKKFITPIEQVILGNSPTQYSFENVSSAYSYGLEAEARKSLGFIPGLQYFTLIMNTSVIFSQVQFDDNSLFRDRPLEGQSPYIINAGIYYQNEKGLMLSLLYNVIGKRIAAVGRPSPNQWEDIPNVYEMPRNVIDLTFSKALGKMVEIKGGIKDLINQKVNFIQTVDAMVDMNAYTNGADNGLKYFNRDQVTRTFRPGRYFSIGVSLKF
jgi:outer membrane receptor for ferrienterochelin and colicin